MPKSNTPYSTKLPSRGALKQLDKTKRTINDYAKATPVTAATPPVTKLIRR